MTILSIDLAGNILVTFLEKVYQLPFELVPDAISQGEGEMRFPVTLEQLIQNRDLPTDIQSGYFLYAPEAIYSVSGLGFAPKIFIEVNSDENAKAIFSRIASIPINYAYGCRYEERKHQNRIVSKKTYGTEEVWVGRDYQRYLPGLYWLNIVPISLLRAHGIDVDKLKSVSLLCQLIEDRNYFIQLYPTSDNWKERAEEIDAWRKATSGVFHKEKAQNALDQAKTFMEASDTTAEWK